MITQAGDHFGVRSGFLPCTPEGSTMNEPHDILGSISGGRVLDVATGSGGFIHFLLAGLKDFSEIIGIDTNERNAEAFAKAFGDKPNIHFRAMDAAHLDFEESSFDMVCVSNSLHHFAGAKSADGASSVLAQMNRILRPGGWFLISEMYRDNQTETQMTHVLLHHWWAAVDTVNGIPHHETYRRQELVDMAENLKLIDIRKFDLCDLDGDPKNPELAAELEPGLARYMERAAGHPELQSRGEELKRRLRDIGFHSASTLVILGKKA